MGSQKRKMFADYVDDILKIPHWSSGNVEKPKRSGDEIAE